jgi:hypothetical protein
MSSVFDPSAFFDGLRKARALYSKGAKRGMAMLLAHGERRAKELTPVKSGTLAGTVVGDPASIKITDAEVSAALAAGGGEAADYAIVQHEAELHHTHPNEGTYAAKFIEKAVLELKAKAGPTLAASMKMEAGA